MSDTADAPTDLLSPDDFYVGRGNSAEPSPEIAAVLAEFGLDGAPVGDEPPPGGEVLVGSAGDPPAEPVTPPADVVAPKVPDEDVRGTLRLLEQENVLRKEREGFRSEREAFQAEVAKFKAAQAEGLSKSDVLRQVRQDPIKFFSDLGIAPEQVSRLIIAGKLGDKAPPEIREAAQAYEYDRKLERLENMIRERDYENERLRVRNGTQDFLGKMDAGDSTYPTLAKVAAVDKTRVTDAIFAEIARDAAERGKTDPNAPLMGYDEAAKRVEDTWAVFHTALTPRTDATATLAIVPPVAPSAVKAAPPAKRPAPPRRYWQEDNDEVEAALAEATATARNYRA